MKHKVFAVFDSKARAYLPPFFLPEQGMAVRAFKDCVRSPDHQFGKHPADYTLFQLGQWDSLTGNFFELKAEVLVNGIQVLPAETPPAGQLALVEAVK